MWIITTAIRQVQICQTLKHRLSIMYTLYCTWRIKHSHFLVFFLVILQTLRGYHEIVKQDIVFATLVSLHGKYSQTKRQPLTSITSCHSFPSNCKCRIIYINHKIFSRNTYLKRFSWKHSYNSHNKPYAKRYQMALVQKVDGSNQWGQSKCLFS